MSDDTRDLDRLRQDAEFATAKGYADIHVHPQIVLDLLAANVRVGPSADTRDLAGSDYLWTRMRELLNSLGIAGPNIYHRVESEADRADINRPQEERDLDAVLAITQPDDEWCVCGRIWPCEARQLAGLVDLAEEGAANVHVVPAPVTPDLRAAAQAVADAAEAYRDHRFALPSAVWVKVDALRATLAQSSENPEEPSRG